MASRRMISKRIISSTKFIKMPQDTQNLYFHLNMNADDDGIVEAYSVMKLIGSPEDNLKVLQAKGFIQILNEDFISYILDWREHNLIRADRKIDSMYKELLLKIVPEAEIIQPKPRADTKKLTGRPKDNQMSAQVRLGKDSIGKNKYYTDEMKDIYYIWSLYKVLQQHTEKTLIRNIHKKHDDIMKDIGVDNVKIAIENYGYIIENPDKFWYTAKFTFWRFLEKIDTFLDSADPLNNYKIKDNKQQITDAYTVIK